MSSLSVYGPSALPQPCRAFKEGLLVGNASLASAIFAYTDSVGASKAEMEPRLVAESCLCYFTSP
jgi:hypothetical protein